MDTDNQTLLKEAKRLYEAREYTQAMPKLRAVLEHDPNNVLALMYVADILCERKHWQHALLVAQQALDIAPKNPIILSLMSKVLHFLSDFDGSVRHAKRAYKIAPQLPIVLKAYIQALAFVEDSATTVKIVPRVLALKDVEGDNSAAIALQVAGKTTESIRVWRTGIRRFLSAAKSPPPPATQGGFGDGQSQADADCHQEHARFDKRALLPRAWHTARNLPRRGLAARRF